MAKSTNERLAEQLDEKEEEIGRLEERIRTLEYQLDGSPHGWREEVPLDDDPTLPIPRLEIRFEPSEERDWRDYKAVYMLVMKHLLGHAYGIPIGRTSIQGGNGSPPTELPFRDGAHIAHDHLLLNLPAFKVLPGSPPSKIDFKDYKHQLAMGAEHRRGEP